MDNLKVTSELKTLKEIIPRHVQPNNLGDLINEKYIKAEAIKWVKECERQNKEEFGGLRAMTDSNWIKHFFNLTEEDLKNE